MVLRYDPNSPWAQYGSGPNAVGRWLADQRKNPQPAAPQIWTPTYFNQPQTPYPANPYAPAGNTTGGRSSGGGGGGGRGGGGVGYRGPMLAVPPEMSLGAGSYWPGHSAEFNAQQQSAILGIMQGRLQPDTRQPAQMAAAIARDEARGIVGGRRVSNFGGGGARGGSLSGGYQSAYDNAQQANEARYADIMGGWQAMRGANRDARNQALTDNETNWQATEAKNRNELIGRGLGNSSKLATMAQGITREQGADSRRIQADFQRYDDSLTQGHLGFMERRTDEGPDMNQAIALAQGLGQAGVGQPQVIGSQVVPTMGGVGWGGGGYNLPVYAAGGGFAGRSTGGRGPVWGGMTAQQIRANAVNQNRHGGSISPAAWSQYLTQSARVNALNRRLVGG